MKKITFSVFLSLVICQISVFGVGKNSVVVDKVIEQTYDFPIKDGFVLIENEFGNVTIKTWDQPRVEAKIHIIAGDKTKEKADERLKKVSIKMSKSASDKLEFITQINSGKKNSYNKNQCNDKNGLVGVEINYEVYIPVQTNIDLTNEFGSIYLDPISGSTKVDQAFGNFTANSLSGSDNKLEMQFGSGNIDFITNAYLDLQHFSMDLGKAESIVLENSFGEINIGDIESINLDMEHGKIHIEMVGHLEGDLSFAPLVIEKLSKHLDIDVEHGNKVKVNYIEPGFEIVDVDAEFSNVKLTFDEACSFDLNSRTEFGKHDLPKVLFASDHEFQKDKIGSFESFEVTKGKNSKGKEVEVEIEYGNFILQFK